MLYFGRVLRHLVEVGDQLVAMIHQEATQIAAVPAAAATSTPDPQTASCAVPPPVMSPVPPPVPPAGPQSDLLGAYERVTRSVRRSIMLYQKLFRPTIKPSARQRIAARRKIIRDVEDAIHCKAPDHEQEILHAELLERLDRPELDNDIADRATADIVTDLCRDLGLAGLHGSHPWKRRIPHDIAILNARAAQLPGAGPSEKLRALLASAPPRPPPPPPARTATITDRELSKLSDEEIETLLEQLRPYPDP
jgi:hypothetical protein